MKKLLTLFTLLLTVCSGAWATDLEIPLTNLKNFPLDYGLVTITNTNNMTISNSQLQASKVTGTFRVSTKIAGVYLKSISFTDANSSKNGGFTCTDNASYMTGPTENVYTYTAPNTTTTEANFQLIGSNGTAKMGTIIITVSTSDQVERLTGFGSISNNKIPFTSSAATSNVELSVPASNGVSASSSRISIGSGGKHLIVSTKNDKVIKKIAIPKYQQPNYTVTGASDPEGTYSNDVWTPSASDVTSVDLTLTVSSTVYSQEIYVIYEDAAPAGITLTNVVNEDGWGTVSPLLVKNIESGTVPSTSSNTYTVGATVVTATPADASAEYTYSFSSWSGLPASVTESATVTANFARTPNSYTLAWNTNGGSELAGDYTSGSIAYGTTITAPNDPTRDGYVFVGWNTANNGSGDDYAGTMPAANTTFYAQWMKPAADIDFNEHVKTFASEATSTDFSLLTTKNYVYELAGNTCFDNSANAPYQGLKMKNSGDYILFLAESGKDVKFTFGFVNTKPTVTIDGVVQPAISVSTGSGHDNQEVTFAANPSNRIFKLTTADGNSMVIKKIEFLTTDARTATTTEITSVSIDALNKDLANGTTGGTLAATVTPDGGDALSTPAIAWTSSNTGVAEINETTGAVTLVAEGTTTITATYAGDVDYKGSTDTYVLTVVDNTSSLTAESNKLWKVGDTNWKTDNIEYTDGFGEPGGDSRDIDGINLPKSTKVTSASTSVNTHLKIANNTTVVVYGRGNASSATTANLYVGDTSGEPVATASWSNDKLYKVAYTNTSGSEQDIYFCGLDNQYRLSGIWVMPNAVDVAITAVGYASFATTYPMNFNESGITAYIATENGAKSVAMTEVTNVPANTGVILKGTSASIPVLGATAADATTGNLLKPGEKTVSAAEAEAGTIYAFGKKGGQVGFVMAHAGFTITAGKAYLDLSGIGGAKGADFLSFVFGDEEQGETDGIKAVSTTVENGVRYNLAGQKVGADYKGIVIVNGKKVIIK